MLTKTALLLFALILLAGSLHADEWDGADKQLHAVSGMFLGFGGYAAADIYNEKQSEFNKVLVGTGVAFSVGLGKELYDMQQPGNHLCLKDLAVTTAAGMLGSLFGTSLTYTDHTLFASRTWNW